MLQDIRVSLRAVAKQPLFAAVAVATLALGIGANTAIFSVVHAVLLEPAPYPSIAPERVVVMNETAHQWDEISVAYPNFTDWQQMSQSFSLMAGFRETRYNMTGVEEPVRLKAQQVSYSYFDIMGARPLAGRFFSAEEDRPGAAAVVVLNYDLWQNRFSGRPDVIGSSIQLDGSTYEIVGVLPPDFEVLEGEQAYVPLEPWAANPHAQAKVRGNHQGLRVLARLKDGVTFDEGLAEMRTIVARLEQEYPDTNTGIGLIFERLVARRVKDYGATLWLLMGAVSLVLVIACTNVAHLLLARSVTRRRDIAIETALGAGRGRLVQRGMVEGVLLALAGGAVGVALAYVGLHTLRGLLPADLPRLHTLALSYRVLAYSGLVSLLTGLLFGGVPALLQTRVRPSDPLREGSRDTGGRSRAGNGLLVVEVALATVLLIGASLLIRTLYELTHVDPGFRPDHILTFQIGAPFTRYAGQRRMTFLGELDERLEALPGVVSATVGNDLPMMGSNWSSIFIVDDRPVPPRGELPGSLFTPVAPGYFETFGIPLREGRWFDETDDADAPRVVVINETLAKRLWPGQTPVGKRLKQGWPEDEGEENPWRTIIGVVGDVKQMALDQTTLPQVYIPAGQNGMWFNVALRTETDPMSLVEPVKRVVASMDRDLPVYDVETMDRVLATSVAPRRFTMILLGMFATLAVALAAIGLYGVVSYSVARRTQEIGVRVSIGADRRDIFRLVTRQGMKLAFVGALIGLATAFFSSRLLESWLFGIASTDAVTFTAAPVLLLVVAFLACSAPALAATRVHPIEALRHE